MMILRCFALFGSLLLFFSGTAQKQSEHLSRLDNIIGNHVLRASHIGVSVYDPETDKYLYNYQGDKYFVPASNVKIVTCYAALKHLESRLPGIRYYENDTAIYLVPTGDPSLLHRDFPVQPVISFLQQQHKKIFITDLNWQDKDLGKGWSWDDYNDEYMVERNALPVYGNTIKWVQEKIRNNNLDSEQSVSVYSDPEVNWKVGFEADPAEKEFIVKRGRAENTFIITEGNENFKEQLVPFVVNGIQSSLELLKDTTGKEILVANDFVVLDPVPKVIWSQPVDSVLKPMMYNSDNFFAEQLLLMVSGERVGLMNDELIIDTLLATDLSDLPQEPVWVDGSGLSRYNLFTPKSFIAILDKMRKEFGMEKLKNIFPAGDSGTLKGYYRQDSKYIYAKTGSMSGVIALSGYLYTRKNKLLVFSFLINNYTGRSSDAKRLIERFIREVRNSN